MNKISIMPLGTVSPYLKRKMNCPGFLIEYNKEKILLDCGNGITRLLDFPSVLKNLNIIITHYHKDHIGDIGTIQYASYVYHNLGLLDDKIKIFLPENDNTFNRDTILANKESYAEYQDINNDYSFWVEDLKLTFQDNHSHTIESYMVKIENDDLKIVYTSDIGTTNFDELIEFCKNADLLISESSFLRKHNSLSKTHLTAYDAGILASKAEVEKLLLTHFWPEESKRAYLKEAKQIFKNVDVAKEGKRLVLKGRR